LASGETVDEEYLTKVGVINRLPNWREQADTLMGLAEA